ncbi:MAG: hypothetical protein AAF327_00295 [Cyanobacteria bacterium P01_A01_bin.37]
MMRVIGASTVGAYSRTPCRNFKGSPSFVMRVIGVAIARAYGCVPLRDWGMADIWRFSTSFGVQV